MTFYEVVRQVLDLLKNVLGASLFVVKGWATPDVERTYARVRALGQHVGDTPQLFVALWGLWVFYVGRGALQTAQDLGEQCLHRQQHH